MLATQLFAIASGSQCVGNERCHWCSAPCGQFWIHDDLPCLPFQVNRKTAKCPGNQFICLGCWLFRRKRTTMDWLGGGFKDGQCLQNHSVWITDKGAWGFGKVEEKTLSFLLNYLLEPPHVFVLSILDGFPINHIQLAVVNDNPRIDNNTNLNFTFNNILHTYSVYELREAINCSKKKEPLGYEPGVRILTEYLKGPIAKMVGSRELSLPENPETVVEVKKGRPRNESRNNPHKTVRMSGVEMATA